MPLIDEEGWLSEARRVLSPNCDDRPVDADISLVVVHGISLPPGEYGGPWIDALFTNQLDASVHPYFETIKDLCVSTHVLVRRDGELVQYVPFTRRAWHAGASCYRGRSACNDYAIGIELEGQDEQPYEAVQYQRLAELVSLLRRHYPGIGGDDIVGHSDIAPERKTDPGPAFDWDRLKTLLA